MQHVVKLNLARNCLKYIIRVYGIKEIFIPYYTCPIVWESLREEKCKIKFYHINEQFMPEINFHKDDYILYINYFGLCSNNCKILSKKYKNLILDNSQAFYADNVGLASFSSLRKFFNVPNGAYLFINNLLHEDFIEDKFQNIPVLIHKNYKKFLQNELVINNEKNIKYINPNIENKMKNIDFEKDKKQRIKIFNQYAEIFDKENNLQFTANKYNIPYCYPFSPKNKDFAQSFIENNLVLLWLWNPIPKNFIEHNFLNNTIALPLNDTKYANKIINIYS